MSVAEVMRHVEPIINRTLTRMAEAADLVVRKRLTVELPESAVPELELDPENNPVPRTFKLEPDRATPLPPGARVVDPFAGAEGVYSGMPFLQLMLQVASQHGVAPIFKGVPPGAQGSGYRDTALYMMAWAQFEYILQAHASALADLVDFLEQQLLHTVRQDVLLDELSLGPKDIEGFPARIQVEVNPSLPQNLIPQGHFYDYMHRNGHITRRRVLKEGMGIDRPEYEFYERMEEDLQEMLKPVLYQDVLRTILGGPAGPGPEAQGAGQGGVLSFAPPPMPGIPVGNPPAGNRALAGEASGGVPRQQPPGVFPPELAFGQNGEEPRPPRGVP